LALIMEAAGANLGGQADGGTQKPLGLTVFGTNHVGRVEEKKGGKSAEGTTDRKGMTPI